MEPDSKKISTFLFFKDQAEQAVRFYTSVFSNSSIVSISRYSENEMKTLSRLPAEARPGPAGTVKVIKFMLDGDAYYAANGGPSFSFSQAISLYVRCRTQDEIDYFWEKLSEGGATEECGWLKDRFGVSWQIAPARLDDWLTDPDPEKSSRVSIAIYNSKKLDIEVLRKAYEGAASA